MLFRAVVYNATNKNGSRIALSCWEAEEKRLALEEQEADERYVEDRGQCIPAPNGCRSVKSGLFAPFDLQQVHEGGLSSSLSCEEQLRLAQAEAARDAKRAAEELEDGRLVSGTYVSV